MIMLSYEKSRIQFPIKQDYTFNIELYYEYHFNVYNFLVMCNCNSILLTVRGRPEMLNYFLIASSVYHTSHIFPLTVLKAFYRPREYFATMTEWNVFDTLCLLNPKDLRIGR